MRTVFATYGHYDHVKDQVMASRGCLGFTVSASFLLSQRRFGNSSVFHVRSLLLYCLFRQGITMASTATRRSPHCFNLMRQMEVLERSGASDAEAVPCCKLFI